MRTDGGAQPRLTTAAVRMTPAGSAAAVRAGDGAGRPKIDTPSLTLAAKPVAEALVVADADGDTEADTEGAGAVAVKKRMLDSDGDNDMLALCDKPAVTDTTLDAESGGDKPALLCTCDFVEDADKVLVAVPVAVKLPLLSALMLREDDLAMGVVLPLIAAVAPPPLGADGALDGVAEGVSCGSHATDGLQNPPEGRRHSVSTNACTYDCDVCPPYEARKLFCSNTVDRLDSPTKDPSGIVDKKFEPK